LAELLWTQSVNCPIKSLIGLVNSRVHQLNRQCLDYRVNELLYKSIKKIFHLRIVQQRIVSGSVYTVYTP